MLRIHYALCHVASQRINRWLPPPLDGVDLAREDPPEMQLNPEDLGDAQVQDFIRWERERDRPRLSWLSKYLAQHDPGGYDLATTFVDYFSRMRSMGGHWFCPVDEAYPPLLALIADPPLGLGMLGDPAVLTRPMVSVVGSRKAAAFAVRECYELGQRLAAQGLTVVSGGALGCDIAAHHGVLASGIFPAPAACVFAGGLAELYPKTNGFVFRRLRDRQAALVSERLWDARCYPSDFHARNRIIAGMSGLTIVMQAAIASGALVTARLAADQGRDLAVLMHPEGDVRAAGSLALILDGATPFSTALALVERLGTAAVQPPPTGPNIENLLRS